MILGAETPEMNIGEVLCRLRCMIDAGKLVVRKKWYTDEMEKYR